MTVKVSFNTETGPPLPKYTIMITCESQAYSSENYSLFLSSIYINIKNGIFNVCFFHLFPCFGVIAVHVAVLAVCIAE